MIHNIRSEYSKLVLKEYKTRHDWVGKVIHWKMCKNFKFEHTNKWYMNNPASDLENDTHKLVWDFDIQTDHLNSVRRPDLNQQKKKKKKKRERVKLLTLLSRLTTEKTERKKDKYLDFARELKKTMEHEGDNCTYRDWCFWYSHQGIIKGTGGLGSWSLCGDYPNIFENGLNTEKNPGDLRRIAVTQTPVKNHQLKLMWKALKQ